MILSLNILYIVIYIYIHTWVHAYIYKTADGFGTSQAGPSVEINFVDQYK